MGPRVAIGVMVLRALAGCRTDPATQIVVVVDSDIPASVMDGFATRVLDAEGREAIDRPFSRSAYDLPADFAIGPRGGDATRTVRVEVEARAGDEVLFTTHAVTGFREGRSLRLDLFLARRCLDEATGCAPDERCTERGCVPAEIAPGDLPDFVPGDPAGDAGDASTPVGTEFLRLLTTASAEAYIVDVAFDPQGGLIVLGQYTGSGAQLEGMAAPFPPAAGSALFLARYAADGSGPEWTVPYEGDPGLTLTDLEVGRDIQVAGHLTGSVDLGDAGLLGPTVAAFHARFALDTGEALGVTPFPSASGARAHALALDASGVVAVVGDFSVSIDLDGVPGPELAGDGLREFVTLLDEEGDYVCHAALLGDAGSTVRTTAVAFDAQGPIVGGTYLGSMAGGELTSVREDGFVAAFDEDCGRRWLQGIDIDQSVVVRSVAPSGDGVTVVGQVFGGLSDLGLPGLGGWDVFTVHLGRGDPILDLAGGSADDFASTAAVRADGHLVIGGCTQSQDPTFGALVLDPPGAAFGFIGLLDDTGAPVSIRGLGGDGAVCVGRLAYSDSTALAAATGGITGRVSFGLEELDAPPASSYLYVFRP